jgi:glycerol-3-phosphate dehydrogenase (NAD(P)+)
MPVTCPLYMVKLLLVAAAGISDGLNLGNNARAALITRGAAGSMRAGLAVASLSSQQHALAGCLVVHCYATYNRLLTSARTPLAPSAGC